MRVRDTNALTYYPSAKTKAEVLHSESSNKPPLSYAETGTRMRVKRPSLSRTCLRADTSLPTDSTYACSNTSVEAWSIPVALQVK